MTRVTAAALPKTTLIVQTKLDGAIPLEMAEYLHKNIKNSHLQFINAEGHLPHISAPAEITAALHDFLYTRDEAASLA